MATKSMIDKEGLTSQSHNTLLRMISLFGYDNVWEMMIERRSVYPFHKVVNEMYGNKEELCREAYDYLLRYKLNLTTYSEGEYNGE